MATIKTAIALEDNFSSILNNIVNAVNMTVSVMAEMQATVGAPIETAAFEGLYDYARQASVAVQELDAALQNMAQPEISAPALTQPVPVELPWHWQSDTMPVFTSAGLERFQQELASANRDLNVLYNTQMQIAAAARTTDWLPDSALVDFDNMQNRLQAIWQQVYQIANNPLNFGTDVANQELERMRGQLALAVQEQERLNAAVDDMDMQLANEAYLQLSQTVSGLEMYIRDNVDAQGEFNQTIHEGVSSAANLGGMLAGAVKAYLGLAGLRKVVDFGQDSMAAFNTQMNAQVQLATVAGNMGMADYYDDILAEAAAIQSWGIYGDEIMIAGAAELSTYFTDSDAVLSMMDTLTNYAAGMSGGGELSAQQMTDYATGLGKVMSGSYDAMTKKGFEFSEAQKAIIEGTASQAMITEQLGAEYVAMSQDMQAAAAINQVVEESWGGLYAALSDTPQGQIIQLSNAFGDLQEQVGLGLYPYVMLVVGAFQANWPTIERVVQGVAGGFNNLLGILSWVVEAGVSVAGALVDNWAWVAPLVYGAVAAFGAYRAALILNNTLQGISALKLAITDAALYMQAGHTALATAAEYGFNAALLACPITWVVAGIIAGVAALTAFCAYLAKTSGAAQTTLGAIAGCVSVVWQLLVNLARVAVNAGLGIAGAILACVGNIGIAFYNTFTGIQEKFYAFVSKLLNGIARIAEGLNSLPFVEFDYSGLTSSANEYANKAALAAAKREEYLDVGAAFSQGWNTFEVFQEGWAAEAFAAGANWGDNLNLFGAQELDLSAYEMLNNAPWDNMDDSLSQIAANTGDMSRELQMTDEDLQYLRDLAEREAVNQFTTAEIVVDMGGITNQINKLDDLDGIVTRILDGVNEAVEIAAEGVHI